MIDSWITAERLKKAPRKFSKWSKANWTEIKAKTTSFVPEFLNQNQKTVQDNYTTFCDHIQSMLDSYIPHGFTKTRTDIPWLTRELKLKCGRKRRMYNKAKRSKQTRHWDIYKEYAKVLKKELRQAHWQRINKILLAAEEDSNPKPFWNYIRSQNQDNIGVAPLKSKGRLHTDANGSQNSIGPIQKCIHQGPRPSLQRHSTIWTKLPSDAILQHHGSRCSKAPPKHQPQQGWRAGWSSLPYAEGAGRRDRPCVDLHIHTEPYHWPGPI